MKALVIFLFVFIRQIVLSQDLPFNISLSAEMKEPLSSYIQGIIDFDENNFYTWRLVGTQKRKAIVEVYDRDLSLVRSGLINPNADRIVGYVDTIIMLDDNIYALTIGFSDNWVEQRIYVYEIDKLTLELKGPPRQIFAENQTADNHYQYCVSSNSRFLSISKGYYKKEPWEQGLHVKTFDGKMQPVWEKEIVYENEKTFLRLGSLIDNNGNVYLYGKDEEQRNKKNRREAVNSTCQLMQIKEKGTQLKSYTIDSQQHIVTDLRGLLNDESKITVLGLCSSESQGYITGYQYAYIDIVKEEIVIERYHNLDTNFTALFNQKPIDKRKQLQDFNIIKIILKNEGGIILLAEQVSQSVITSNIEPHMRKFYNYDDILILNVNPDGSLAWSTRIAKKQSIEDLEKNYSSFACFMTDKRLFVIYNDNPDNRNITSPDAVAENTHFAHSVAVAVEIDAQGKMKKMPFLSSHEEGQILRPIVSEQTNQRKMLLYADKGEKYRIGMIELK